ncbi:hypothetical protein V4V35_26080, partial [Bacillus infantis]|uniref:hypothetical protein n=1 Tax=Bacillus infantis TaxID=324767 RepID=UPI002FBF19A2
AAAKKAAADAQKGFNQEMSRLALDYKAGKIDTSDYISSLENMKKQYKTVPNAISKVDAQIVDLRKKHAKEVEEAQKKDFE